MERIKTLSSIPRREQEEISLRKGGLSDDHGLTQRYKRAVRRGVSAHNNRGGPHSHEITYLNNGSRRESAGSVEKRIKNDKISGLRP